MTRFEIRRQLDGGATVFAVEPVWLANFRDHADAEAFVRMRQANEAHAALMAEEAALKTMLAETSAGQAEIAIDPVPDDEPEPDLEDDPEDLPEDDAAALAALAARADDPAPVADSAAAAADETAPITDHPPRVEITLIPAPADPTGGDPYHEAGEAFARLKAGEQLGAVADALRLKMPVLRSRWARYQQGLKALNWQPGATVPKPEAPPLDEGWCQCARCKTRFNAAKAQADARLPSRPTLCAACRSR